MVISDIENLQHSSSFPKLEKKTTLSFLEIGCGHGCYIFIKISY